jgi:hypothetical protein
MNFLFRTTSTYHVDLPYEQVEARLKYITTRRYEDYSIDLVGQLDKEGKFPLTHKWGITNLRWIENRYAYLIGELRQKDEGTEVRICIRPNLVLIVLFLLGMVCLFAVLFNLKISALTKELKLLTLIGFNLLVFWLMIICSKGLKKRFEELMRI